MIAKNIAHLDLDAIANSGQCFRWTKLDDYKYGIPHRERYLVVENRPGSAAMFDCTLEEFEQIWIPYFDLGRDYQEVLNRIPASDSFLTQAAEKGRGIRILQQDLFEVMVSFLISQNNNMPRIRSCIEMLCTRFGQCHPSTGGFAYYAFPTPAALQNRTDLQGLGLGYRDKYIAALASCVVNGSLNLPQLQKMPYPEALACLKTLYGIGEKVANCICLFGLHHVQAFPRDVWVNRIVSTQYNGSFPLEQYKGVAGIIQQYMFYAATTAPRSSASSSQTAQ